ncbi:hypothetical protein CPC16_010187 [Podila verticillata]|nr:hypothetical protein CPC16_010187 [Podila verticillata]
MSVNKKKMHEVHDQVWERRNAIHKKQDVDMRAVPGASMLHYNDLAWKEEKRPPCTARYCVFALEKLLIKNWKEVGQPASEARVGVDNCAGPRVYHDLMRDAEGQLQYAVEARVGAIDSADQINTLGALRDNILIENIDVGRETIHKYIGENVSDEEVITHSLAVWQHGVVLGRDVLRMWRAWYCAERRVAGRQHTASTIDVRPCVRQRMLDYARILCLLNGKRQDNWHFDTRTAVGILLIKSAAMLPEGVDEVEFVAQSVACQLAGNWASFGKDVERYEVSCVWSVMNVQPEHVRHTRVQNGGRRRGAAQEIMLYVMRSDE